MYKEFEKLASDLAKKRQVAQEQNNMTEVKEIDGIIHKLIDIMYGKITIDKLED